MSDQEKRKKALFEALDSAEKNLNRNQNTIQQNTDYFSSDHNSRHHQRHKIDKYKNKKSIFKKPSLPLRRCLPSRGRANHEINPEKYTKYSLSDVSDLSDMQNKTAAYNFLKEMEARKLSNQEESASPSSSSEPTKIIFKNSIKLKDHDGDNEKKNEERRIQGSKFVMAEYVVGEKKESKKKEKNIKNRPLLHMLKLSHLDQEEDE